MKKYNFNAGPSILPREVIENTAKQILDFNGTGLSLAEISHRSKDFQPVVDEAESLIKEILNIPEGYSVLFLGGGASLEFCMVPFNFLIKKAAYLNTGTWAKKAMKEAKLFGDVVEVASSADANYTFIPKGWDVPADADSLAFEYSCTATPAPNVLQVWFGKFTSAGFVFADDSGTPTQKIYTNPLNPTNSDEFVTYKVNVAAERAAYPYFGEKSNLCFLSFYYPAGTVIKVRNLRLYDKPETGVKTVGADSKFTAVGGSGTITVNAPASIYNLAGSMVGTTSATISVPAGLYLVKSGTSTLKVLVK